MTRVERESALEVAPFVAAGATSSEGTVERKVDVLLAVDAHQK